MITSDGLKKCFSPEAKGLFNPGGYFYQSEGLGTDYGSPWVRGWSEAERAWRLRVPTRARKTLTSAGCIVSLTV